MVASAVIIILLASHPELRLLVPLVDALGLDLFIFLLGAQAWEQFKPVAAMLYRVVVRPAGRNIYSTAIFFFGYLGPYVHARISTSIRGYRLAL
jgi:hypothetical protein